MSVENAYVTPGGERQCRACRRIREARRFVEKPDYRRRLAREGMRKLYRARKLGVDVVKSIE